MGYEPDTSNGGEDGGEDGGERIAVVGLAGRFPGARDTDEFWANLADGVESIVTFTPDELAESGFGREVYDHPDYVPRRGALADIDLFDAEFFDLNASEAEMTDPQQRLFLECAWEALEHAGCDPSRFSGRAGVYAGQSMNSYLLGHFLRNTSAVRSFYLDQLPVLVGSNDDFLTTRVAYKLDLRGPAVRVQTACSTSLVAVHLASQALLAGECDLALAGGVAVQVPQRMGYVHRTGDVMARDGHCRAFDRASTGVVGGSGLGVVVLKRLADAEAAGDTVHAVLLGTAVNNDGSAKVGYTAPSVRGQAEVISEALEVAGVPADTISYVEAHGTGTALGDPIEVRALTQAYRATTDRTGYCALGSVKTNIGHLDAAAGIAGLIKTVLALRHRKLPASLHFTEPNPELGLADSPFYVNDRLADWPATGTPRRAGVSSFGIGGTNAHVVLEEAPPPQPAGPSRPEQLVLVSARTPAAALAAATRLADHLRADPAVALADVAHTLRVGRRQFDCRIAVVGRDRADTVAALAQPRVSDLRGRDGDRPVVFQFPGQGAQHAGMGLGLYRSEPVYRAAVDECADLVRPHLGVDLRAVLSGAGATAARLDETWLAQPALFTVEYALARLLAELGVRPTAMIGHSVGEYVAACLAGVLDLADALALVVARGRLTQSLPEGAMLSLPVAEDQARAVAGDELAVAAVNGPFSCVLSGSPAAVAAAERRAAAEGVTGRRTHVTRAFHSAMVEPVLDQFTELVGRVPLRAPELAYVSNVTGTWITADQATSPEYWRDHLRHTVRYADGLTCLRAAVAGTYLEVGPGRTLTALAPTDVVALSTCRHPRDDQPDTAVLLRTFGQLWASGVEFDWDRFDAHERRTRVPLPTYPFERRRYWLDRDGDDRPVEPEPDTPVRLDGELGGGRHQRPRLATAYAAPRDDLERAVAEVWQHLLGYEQVGVHDNFFSLGGNSLLTGRLLALLREKLGVDLPLDRLYRAQTVAEQGELVRELGEPRP